MPTVNQSEAARRLGVSRRTVKRRIDAGELPTVDTPDGVHVVLPEPASTNVEPDVPTPPIGHAHNAHHVPTSDKGEFPSPFISNESLEKEDLAARLERAESRIDRLLETVQEQNRTIQAQTIRLAQLEGRMIDTRAAEVPAEPREHVPEPDIPTPRRGGLRAWYMRWRSGF